MKAARWAIAWACLVGGIGVALAQSGGGYSVRRHSGDGGGARMSGASGLVLQGTVAQADANAAVLAGAQGYALRGGFWVAGAAIVRGDAVFADGFE